MKRLRNTAASARFRAKKKMREQTLESQAREKRERLERLENRIAELERENSFLKGLIMGPKDEELKVSFPLPLIVSKKRWLTTWRNTVVEKAERRRY